MTNDEIVIGRGGDLPVDNIPLFRVSSANSPRRCIGKVLRPEFRGLRKRSERNPHPAFEPRRGESG